MVVAYTEPRGRLLEVAKVAGFVVTPQQLARWHRVGLLPRPVQRGQGRGRGTVTLYPGGRRANSSSCAVPAPERAT